MKKIILAGLFVTLCILPIGAKTQKQRRIENTIKQLKEELISIEDSYIDQLDFKERREAINKIDRMMEKLDIILQMNTSPAKPEATPAPTITPEPVPTPNIKPLNKKQFTYFLKDLGETNSTEQKYSYIRTFTKRHSFTTVQSKFILDEFKFNNQLITVFKMLYPSISDKENIQEMIEGFNSLILRKKLRETYYSLLKSQE